MKAAITAAVMIGAFYGALWAAVAGVYMLAIIQRKCRRKRAGV